MTQPSLKCTCIDARRGYHAGPKIGVILPAHLCSDEARVGSDKI